MEYKLVEMKTESPTEFSAEVNKEIRNGWVPLGGVRIFISSETSWYYIQTMTRNDTEKENI